MQPGVLQQRLGRFYNLESLDTIIEGYNSFRNKLQDVTSRFVDPTHC